MNDKIATIYVCDCCGRDFESEDDPHGPDGVIWCPYCKPEY